MEHPVKQTVWRWLNPFFKMVVAFGLVGFLWQQGKLDFSALLILTSTPWVMVMVVSINLLAYSMVAWRWVILLHSQHIALPFAWAHRVTYIGLFFNLVLPGGGMAGDALRMAYALRSAPNHRPEAILSLFVDRAIGLYAMLLICLLAIVGNPLLAMRVAPLKFMAMAVALMVLGGPLLALLLYQVARRSTRLKQFLSAQNPSRLHWIMNRGIHIIRLYRHSLPQLLQALLLSIVAQGLSLCALVVVANIMVIGTLQPWEYIFATPWAWMANFIPLTPGGIGVGEATFDQVCRWIETTPSSAAYGTIFLVYRILSMMATLPGLFAYLFFRHDVNAAIKTASH